MDTVFQRDEAAGHISHRIRWGAIVAGAILAVGLWILFHVLGLAAGLTAIDPSSPGSLRAAGIGTGVWSVIASLLALFGGGVVAGRLAGPIDRLGGALHGAVLWALTTIAGVVLIVSVAGMLLNSAAHVGGAAVSAAGSLGNLAEGADPMRALGLDAKDLLAPVNQQLQAQGKPAVTPEQLQSAVQAAAKTALQQGRFDRGVLISALEHNTALTRADVEGLVTQVEQRMGAIGQHVERAETGALQAAESTGKGLWWVFGALLLGLITAVGGASLGAWPTKRRAVEHVREVHHEMPLGTPAPVHS